MTEVKQHLFQDRKQQVHETNGEGKDTLEEGTDGIANVLNRVSTVTRCTEDTFGGII